MHQVPVPFSPVHVSVRSQTTPFARDGASFRHKSANGKLSPVRLETTGTGRSGPGAKSETFLQISGEGVAWSP